MEASASSRRVVLGVTASIAAYKSAQIVRLLIKSGFAVRCVLTPSAARFVTPLTLAVLSGSPALGLGEDASAWDMAHLSLADWADFLLIAPATADFISRLACGSADTLLGALALAWRGNVVVCPAMDGGMWDHPATKANVARIKGFGCRVWGPEKGELASGKIGIGRMVEPESIVENLKRDSPLSPLSRER